MELVGLWIALVGTMFCIIGMVFGVICWNIHHARVQRGTYLKCNDIKGGNKWNLRP